MPCNDNVLKELASNIKTLNDRMPYLKDLNELLLHDIRLREREYALRLFELKKQGIREETVCEAAIKSRG